MRMNKPLMIAAAMLLAVGACAKPDQDAADAPAAAAPAETALQADVRRAAAIANALAAMPVKADSILAANSTSAEQLEQMMYRIARDSTASAEYARLTGR
jgi:hypothetical protein